MLSRGIPGVGIAQVCRRLALACLLAPAALALAPAAVAATRPADGVVPAWAMIDGQLPVSGATVSVVTTGDGRSVQSTGSMQRTYATGTFVFHANRPLRNFTVTVTGGRVAGKPFDGTMRAVVRAYRPLTVVHVNPLTTVVAAYLDRHPELSPAEATRNVKRLLGLPKWATIGRDVRRSRALFDGSKFLVQASDAGGFDRLIQQMVQEVDEPGTHVFHATRLTRAGTAATVDGAGILASTASSLADGALGYVGGDAAGWLLAQFGLGDGIDSDLAQIQQQLQQIGQDLTEIKSELSTVAAAVVQGTYSQLAADAAPILGAVDYAEGQLSLLANLPTGAHPADFSGSCTTVPQDDERAIIACGLVQYVQAHLVGQDAILNKLLVQPAPGADSILVAASKAVRAGTTTFYDSTESDEVASVQSYYSVYEAELLNLLVEYDHTLGAAGTDEAQLAVQQMSAPATGYAAQQAAVMKPAFPAGQVLDLRTNLVWQQAVLATGPAYSYDTPSFNGAAGVTAPWSLPSGGQVDGLISGWTGSPETWLQTNAQFDFTAAAAYFGNRFGNDICGVWTTDFYPSSGIFALIGICPSNGGAYITDYPDNVGAAYGFVFRPLDPSESYWYSP